VTEAVSFFSAAACGENPVLGGLAWRLESMFFFKVGGWVIKFLFVAQLVQNKL
jgi:hypothetical protein